MIFFGQLLFPSRKIVPLYPSDDDALGKLKSGVDYKFEVTQPRNYEFHKKFMALVNLGFTNQERINDFDDYRYVLTMKAGWYKRIKMDKGTIFRPKSISFGSMDNLEFQELYGAVIDVLCKELDLSKPEIENELINFF